MIISIDMNKNTHISKRRVTFQGLAGRVEGLQVKEREQIGRGERAEDKKNNIKTFHYNVI